MDFFILNIIIMTIGLSLCASPIGCLVIWQRMSYFGDSLSHSILVGIMVSVAFNLSPLIGGLGFAIIIAIMLSSNDNYSNDLLLGIISQSSLAISIIISTYFYNIKTELNNYLFGDILAINTNEILQIYILAIMILSWLFLRWRDLLTIIISIEMAYCEEVKVKKIRLELMILIAITVTFAVKIVGALLINSLLIIPSASARIISKSPFEMIKYSILISIISSISGVILSTMIDSPTSASIIMINIFCFIMLNIFSKIQR